MDKKYNSKVEEKIFHLFFPFSLFGKNEHYENMNNDDDEKMNETEREKKTKNYLKHELFKTTAHQIIIFFFLTPCF